MEQSHSKAANEALRDAVIKEILGDVQLLRAEIKTAGGQFAEAAKPTFCELERMSRILNSLAKQISSSPAFSDIGKRALAFAAGATAILLVVGVGTGWMVRAGVEAAELQHARREAAAAMAQLEEVKTQEVASNAAFFYGCQVEGLEVVSVDGKKFCQLKKPTLWQAVTGNYTTPAWQIK